MKKTVIINISGMVFHIDEDAYEKLRGYLDSLGHYFGNTTESREIVSDIEARIAELLTPKISDSKQSVTIEDVEEILSILGTPEDIAASGSSAYDDEAAASDTSYTGRRSSRRLYRDVENSVIGGVCSGLGAYFTIDPVFFRIIFIALIFAGGVSFIIYPILWIVVPAARTAAQKLEMRGKDVNLSNIEKTVREEFKHIRENMNKPDSVWSRIGDFFNELFRFLGIFLRGIFQVLRYVIGAFLILIAIFLSIGVIGALYFKNFAFHGEFNNYFTSVQDFLYGFISPLNADTMLFLLFVIFLLPVAGLIYLGLKLLINFQARQKWIVTVLFVFWVFSVISFTVLAFNEADNFRSENEFKETIALRETSGKMLYVTTPGTEEKDGDFLEFYSHSRLFLPLKENNKEDFAGLVSIDVDKTSAAVPEIQIVREARGEDRNEALESARKVRVNFSQNDSVLSIDPFFRVTNDKRWKFYHTKIIIRIPVGTKIYFNENTRKLLHNVRNLNDYWDENMVNKTWIMTENGLELMGSNFSEVISLNDYGNKVLNLQLRERYGINRDKLYRYNDNRYGKVNINNKKYYYGPIRLDILKSETNKVQVELLRTASGRNSSDAERLSGALDYSFEQNDSVLWLDPVFLFAENNRWSDQKMRVVIRVPINRKVYISDSFEPLMGEVSKPGHMWLGHYMNRSLTMGNEGLVKTE